MNATVQFVEMVRQAYAGLLASLERRWCLVCEAETDQVEDANGFRCLVCGYVEEMKR